MGLPEETGGLSVPGCSQRLEVFQLSLRRQNIEAALITDPRHVYYLTGYWGRQIYAPLLLVEADDQTTLALPFPNEKLVVASEVVVYESHRNGTLVDDQFGAAVTALGPRLSKLRTIGLDGGVRPGLLPDLKQVDILPLLLAQRRAKREDEVALIERAIRCTEAAYVEAKRLLCAGITEVELYARAHAAAIAAAGESIGEFGNDFQIGAVGSAPRPRAAENGEVAILDYSIVLRGYRSDMCRSFVVGGEPSELQCLAHERILKCLDHVEIYAEPGRSCRELYDWCRASLDASFAHHLGHGIGLFNHEAPRLSPTWDDRLEVGDVFTIEPGLYHPELRAGLRIEQVYHLTRDGLRRLTTFPVDLD